MISTSAIALSGLNAAQTRLHSGAHNIANLGTPGFHRQEVLQASRAAGGVDVALSRAESAGPAMEADMVDMLQAKNAFLANLAVFKAGDRVTGSLLDVLS